MPLSIFRRGHLPCQMQQQSAMGGAKIPFPRTTNLRSHPGRPTDRCSVGMVDGSAGQAWAPTRGVPTPDNPAAPGHPASGSLRRSLDARFRGNDEGRAGMAGLAKGWGGCWRRRGGPWRGRHRWLRRGRERRPCVGGRRPRVCRRDAAPCRARRGPRPAPRR